jgi:uncharacterized cupin superfamily protein
MRRINLHQLEFGYDEADPPGYRAGMARFGPRIGAAMLGASLYELPEGQSICPYHYEYGNEEWLVVLEGRPRLRHPEGEDVLEPGDVVCFPVGREGAHKVTNDTGAKVRVLMISTLIDPSVAVYPDSDKLGFWSGDERDKLLVRRSAGVEYYDGELGEGHKGQT